MHLSEHLFLPWRTGAVCLGAGGRQREDVVAVLVQVEDVIVLVVILKKKKIASKTRITLFNRILQDPIFVDF